MNDEDDRELAAAWPEVDEVVDFIRRGVSDYVATVA
jgi:hypothetical protein